jgi:hypothetical protein
MRLILANTQVVSFKWKGFDVSSLKTETTLAWRQRRARST